LKLPIKNHLGMVLVFCVTFYFLLVFTALLYLKVM
jgi:hypothetical protein